MIVKKPYAFLIRKFKLIHMIMFGLLVYVLLKSFDIFSFFNSYANSFAAIDYSNFDITFFLYLSCFIIIILSLIIYYLLSKKNKPYKFYIFNAIYYSAIIIYFILVIAQIKDLEYSNLSFEGIRFIRDISLIILIPQVIVTFFVLSRGLGFNIKSFDFQKDIKGLDISSEDAEEIEVNLGKDSYKYMRGVRKALRYTKYFILENKFFVTIVCSVFSLIISLIIITDIKESIKYYNEQEKFIANSIYYTINEAFIVNDDTYDNIISDGKCYLLIKINLKNSTSNNVYLDRDNFRLSTKNGLLFPKFNYYEEFIDVGEVFSPFNLTSGSKKDVVLVFELNTSEASNEYLLKVKNTNLNVDQKYYEVLVKSKILKDSNNVNNYSMNSYINFDGNVLNGTRYRLNSYEIKEVFNETYRVCDGECKDYTYIVRPNTSGNYIMKVNSNVIGDNSYLKYPFDFYKYFVLIKYRTYGNVYNIRCNVLNTSDLTSDYVYIEVPSSIVNANKIEFVINNRENKYNLVLK